MFNYIKAENTLTYFYLIDIDSILRQIKCKLENEVLIDSENLASRIFPIIFFEIWESCSPYIDFIISPNSFNFSKKCDTTSWHLLLHEVLQNHCILNGFLNSIITGNSDSTVKMSGATNLQLKAGYFKTNYFSEKPGKTNEDLIIGQKYIQYKKRFNNHCSNYSYQYLKRQSTATEDGYLKIPSYNGNWGCFIYTNSEVNTLNKNISNSYKNILTNYNNLYSKCLSWIEENHLLPEDRFLFEYAMESIYGFSFFSYISKLLNRVHSTLPGDTQITLKDLEGSQLLNYIQKVAQLPIIYNRSVFLEYVIHKILKSNRLNALDYTQTPKSLFARMSSNDAPKDLLISSGFEQISKYLRKLTYITIPLLENMWNVIVERLNNEFLYKKACPITTDTYRTYVKENYKSFAKDYSCCFYDTALHNITTESISAPATDTLLYRKFNYTENLYSKYEKDSFSTLLFNYLKIERFTQPQIFDLLLSHTKTNTKGNDISSYTNELAFHTSHIENIFSFAEKIF